VSIYEQSFNVMHRHCHCRRQPLQLCAVFTAFTPSKHIIYLTHTAITSQLTSQIAIDIYRPSNQSNSANQHIT